MNPPAPQAPPAPEAVRRLRLRHPPERVLLLRPSALGDVGRTVPALVSIARAFPSAAIDWLVNRPFVPAIASHPDLHEAIPFDRDRPGTVPALLGRLRERRYDLAFDLQGLARTGAFLAASGARVRVTDRAAREGAWLGGNRRLRVPPHPHAVDRLLALIAACGIEPVADLTLFVDPADRAAGAVERERASVGGRFLAVAPTARWGSKRWPIERFAAAARAVAERGTPVLGLFGPADRGARDAWEAAVRGPGVCGPVAAASPASVGVLMAHLEAAAGLLANDSAALHLAVGLGTPSVSLFGPTDPAAVGPYAGGLPDAQHEVLRPADPPPPGAYRRLGDDDRHMRGIPEAAVDAALSRLLAAGTARPAAASDADRPSVA